MFIYVLAAVLALGQAYAQPPQPGHGYTYTRAFYMRYNNRTVLYNPFTTFGGGIRFTVAPNQVIGGQNQGAVTFNFPGNQTVVVPLAGRTTAAANVWANILRNDMPLNPAPAPNQANVMITTVTELGNGVNDPYAYARPSNLFGLRAFPPQAGGMAGFIAVTQTITITDQELQLYRQYFGNNATFQRIAELILYTIMMHEFGHMLGLAHPDTNEGGFYTRDINLPIVADNPIMNSGLLNYLNDLFNYYGQTTLDETEIVPSVGEQDTVLYLIRNCFVGGGLKKSEDAQKQCFNLKPGTINGLPVPVGVPYIFGDGPNYNSTSWSSFVVCLAGGLLLYQGLSCTDAAGGINFKATLWGLSEPAGSFVGYMSFRAPLADYKEKDCAVTLGGEVVLVNLFIDCKGLDASMTGGGIDVGLLKGSGRFE